MATKKQMLEAKSAALDAVFPLFQDQPDKSKGILSEEKLLQSEPVYERYVEYKTARDAFKKARMELMLAKTNLQYVLDIPLYEGKKISRFRYWDFDIDEHGNLRYQDADKDFEKKFKEFVRKHLKDKTLKTSAYDDNDIFFDEKDPVKSAEDLLSGTAEVPQGTPEGTTAVKKQRQRKSDEPSE